jgi:hypothetical protein
MALSYYETGGETVSSSGVFIPITALPGLLATELASSEATATKESKVILAMLNALFIEIAAMTPLGMSATKSKASVNNDVDSLSFTFGLQYLANHPLAAISSLPLPAIGANAGVGGLAIVDVFPAAASLSSGNVTPASGVLVPNADIDAYSDIGSGTVSVNTDNRIWFSGLLGYLADQASLRTATVASALTARARSGTNSFTLPPTATDPTNPTTGIDPSNLSKLSFFSHTFSFTLHILLNQTAQTFDVNAVTA